MLLIDKLTNKVDFSKSEIIIADFIIQLGEKIVVHLHYTKKSNQFL